MHTHANDNGTSSADTYLEITNGTFIPPAHGTAEWFALMAYNEWLLNERRLLCHVMGWGSAVLVSPAHDFHYPPDREWTDVQTPAARAEAVLRLVGVDLDAMRAWALEEVADLQRAASSIEVTA